MLDRLKGAFTGAGTPKSEVLPVTGPEPCEDCGATPADDLVGVRWLCGSCAPAARREEFGAWTPNQGPAPTDVE